DSQIPRIVGPRVQATVCPASGNPMGSAARWRSTRRITSGQNAQLSVRSMILRLLTPTRFVAAAFVAFSVFNFQPASATGAGTITNCTAEAFLGAIGSGGEVTLA